MIGSRVGSLLRIASQRTPARIHEGLIQQVRFSGHGEWYYRSKPEIPTFAKWGSTLTACLLWWWFYWNLWHGWKHVAGYYDHEKPLPDPRHDFTDEELGIPPDE